MTNRIHFHDIPRSTSTKEKFEKLSAGLREEFPEIQKLEVSLKNTSDEVESHLRVTGKDLDLASSATRRDPHESLTEAFERLRKQVRKRRDKTIFTRRRSAQKSPRG